MRTLQTLDYADAKRAVDLIVEELSQMQKAAVLAVADVHGDLLYLARMGRRSSLLHSGRHE